MIITDMARFFEIGRYAGVGAIAFVVDFGVLYTLSELFAIHYLIAATAGFGCGLVTNYLLCLKWVFNSRSIKSSYIEFLIFAIIGVIGLIVNDLIIFILTAVVGLNYLKSKLVAAGLVFFWNYFARKYSLFSTGNTKLGGSYVCR
ncbi:MAG: polysaccharide synthesis protein GtrA [Firmicutes bacterium]|nr:polysaccharide synthesis protein GtrA [Bacillota bacterium]